MTRSVLVLVGLLVLARAPLEAQGASLFVGGVHARYADSIAGSGGLVGLRVDATHGKTAGSVDAGFSQFLFGESATQLAAQGVAVWTAGQHASAGLLGLAGFDTFGGGSWSGLATAGPVLLWGTPSVSSATRLSVGALRRTDGSQTAVGTIELRSELTASRPTRLYARIAGTTADTIRFLDAAAGLVFERGIARLEGEMTLRAGDLSDNPAWHLRAEVRPTPTTTIEGSLGVYARDVTGFTSGGFATIGMRMRVGASAARAHRTVAVRRLGQKRVRVSIDFAGADQVAIAGEWNSWTPEALARGGRSRWTTELPLAPGVYRFSLLVDRKKWTVPDGVATVPDDFGGTAALLVIP